MPRLFLAILLLCLSLHLLKVKAVKVDRIQNERRKAAVAHRIGQHAAGEGKEQAGCFGEEERMNLFVGDVTHSEQAAIGKVRRESCPLRGLCLYFDLQDHLKDIIAGFF